MKCGNKKCDIYDKSKEDNCGIGYILRIENYCKHFQPVQEEKPKQPKLEELPTCNLCGYRITKAELSEINDKYYHRKCAEQVEKREREEWEKKILYDPNDSHILIASLINNNADGIEQLFQRVKELENKAEK